VLAQQLVLYGDRALERRLTMGHDGVVRRPRGDRKAVIPDLAVAGVGVLDHMEGGGLRGARGGKCGGGNDGGSGNGM
jgi:hypothetical protein